MCHRLQRQRGVRLRMIAQRSKTSCLSQACEILLSCIASQGHGRTTATLASRRAARATFLPANSLQNLSFFLNCLMRGGGTGQGDLMHPHHLQPPRPPPESMIVEGARVSGYNQNVQLVSACWVAVTQNAVTVTLMVVSAKMTESGTCTCQGLLKTFSRVLLAHKTRLHPHLTSSCPALLQEHGHDKPDRFVPFLKSLSAHHTRPDPAPPSSPRPSRLAPRSPDPAVSSQCLPRTRKRGAHTQR